ncbi:shikimate kinase [Salicibibacter halophilus]|uniref:Shikimate kinase n=1 Tax=Salicibibacter halophilus TaxID=2502791 RepID=A0A514LIN1_9BACI|nr:shikimate kinase [Salicibibacter halophilus]QDI91709.1 shikimate kinase [Salicibibacter halophilus]
MATSIDETILLTGFMGSGKTMIGEALAKKLNKPFADIDKIIEEKEGMPIKDIFKKEGEAAFRAKEKAEITNYLTGANVENAVVSVGGGAFLQEDIRDLCMENATVVFLHISWQAWLDRMDMLVATRPVLHGKTISEIRSLYEERQAIYARHHLKITVDGLDPEEASGKIITAF